MGEAFTVKVVIPTQLTTIKTHSHVSAAKKDVLHTGALSTGINKEPFPLISLLVCTKFTNFMPSI